MVGLNQDPGRLAAVVDVLVPVLSGGRRRRGRVVTGSARAWRTDLRSVFVPFPDPEVEAGAAGVCCGVALQSAPSKEVAAALPLERMPGRQRRALVLAEGSYALGWALSAWPGLERHLRPALPGVEPREGPAVPEVLFEAARRLSAGRRRVEIPPLLGESPGRPDRPRPGWTVRERARARMPFSDRKLHAKVTGDSVPIGGGGGHGAPRSGPPPAGEDDSELSTRDARLGVPYDEWDTFAGAYRRRYTTVLERTVSAGDEPAPVAVGPEVAAWFRRSPDRLWHRRLEEGSDLDVDAFVERFCDLVGGQAVEDRFYRDLQEGPRDVATALLLDVSGSLDARRGESLRLELECADALAGALAEAREPHGVFAFRSDTRHLVEVLTLRPFSHPETPLPRARALRPAGYTRLGAAIRHVSRLLLDVPAGRRILLMAGDGLPSDEGYEGRYAEADVAKAVEEAETEGIVVHYLGVGRPRRDPLPAMFRAPAWTRVDSAGELPRALAAVHEELCDR